MKYVLIIKGRMTSFNDYINAERHNRYEAADIKKTETDRVAWEAKAQKIPHFTKKVNISYRFFVDSNRTDEDSHLLSCKFVGDGLVKAGIIANDGRKHLHIKKIEFADKGLENKIEIELEEVLDN